MTKKQPGETFQYENILYSIGGWIQCTEGSDYAGLSGVIMEIRDGEDRETDNPAPDIYCRLDRKSTRLNSSHSAKSRMPSSA